MVGQSTGSQNTITDTTQPVNPSLMRHSPPLSPPPMPTLLTSQQTDGSARVPVTLFFFMCLTDFWNSSYVSESSPSGRSSDCHACLTTSNSVVLNFPTKNYYHSSSNSSDDWIMSPFLVFVGCGDWPHLDFSDSPDVPHGRPRSSATSMSSTMFSTQSL